KRDITSGEEYAELHAEIVGLREELVDARLVKAGTLPLSEAMFQNIVNEWAESSGVNILSMRVLPLVEKGGLGEMRMAINTRAEIGGIQNFMERVEQGRRFIFFEEVEIKMISPHEKRYYYFNAQLTCWTL
ncbi:MAG TPA: hypothetical protein ENN94_02430, partial [Geoalkalibacter subterraneus]|nr:hypothetical protein [Geoalkalibacter subterraneus]